MPEIMQSALGSVAVPMLFFLQEVEIKLFYVNTLTGGCRVRLKKCLTDILHSYRQYPQYINKDVNVAVSIFRKTRNAVRVLFLFRKKSRLSATPSFYYLCL